MIKPNGAGPWGPVAGFLVVGFQAAPNQADRYVNRDIVEIQSACNPCADNHDAAPVKRDRLRGVARIAAQGQGADDGGRDGAACFPRRCSVARGGGQPSEVLLNRDPVRREPASDWMRAQVKGLPLFDTSDKAIEQGRVHGASPPGMCAQRLQSVGRRYPFCALQLKRVIAALAGGCLVAAFLFCRRRKTTLHSKRRRRLNTPLYGDGWARQTPIPVRALRGAQQWGNAGGAAAWSFYG